MRMRLSLSSMVASSADFSSSGVLGRAQGLVGLVAQARQGRLEIVGDVVGHLLHAAHQFADAVEHVVEVLREAVELVAGSGDLQPAAEIARHDVAGGLRHVVDALEHAARDEPAAERSRERR